MTTPSNKTPLIIDECDGTETLLSSQGIFSAVAVYGFGKAADKKFESSFLSSKADRPTKEMAVNIYPREEGSRSSTPKSLFLRSGATLEELCLTQHQIVKFCQQNKALLTKWKMETLVLFKLEDIDTIVLLSLEDDNSGGLQARGQDLFLVRSLMDDRNYSIIIPAPAVH